MALIKKDALTKRSAAVTLPQNPLFHKLLPLRKPLQSYRERIVPTLRFIPRGKIHWFAGISSEKSIDLPVKTVLLGPLFTTLVHISGKS